MFREIEPGLGVRKPGFCHFSRRRPPGVLEQIVFPCLDGPVKSDIALVDKVVIAFIAQAGTLRRVRGAHY